ncbi:MAG TPA: hypothetical protein VIY49_06610 [Bryobacteraceae bacterium]
MLDQPLILLALSFLALWLSAEAGAYFQTKHGNLKEVIREDLGTILAAALTLLGLIIGFSFSMAVERYDERKNYEEAEANAIGTEYVRASLLPPADAAKVRGLLKSYVNLRIQFYTMRGADRLNEINVFTERLQADLWSAVQTPAAVQPTPLAALAVSGMNDVLNSQGYAQAAWWNRIPLAAWALMEAIAICCNLLSGYVLRLKRRKIDPFVILPLLVSISFYLIAELDSPRGGFVRVSPQNLISLHRSFSAP